MKTNLSIWLMIACLVVGVFGGSVFFASEKIVTEEVPVNVTVEVEKIVKVPVEVEVEVFGYRKFMDASWEIVIDEFENELESCINSDGDDINYDIDDEIEFEISEDATLEFSNWDKGKFTLTYNVEAEYDDGDDYCEDTFTIGHDFKNFEPRDEGYITGFE